MFQVADLMTHEVVTLKETDELGLAEAILDLGRIRHLPVVRDEKLVGLVTHRDLLRALAEGRNRRVTAADVMQRELRTATPESSLREAAQVMLEFKLGCLPVIDRDRNLVGIITEADLVRFALEVIEDFDQAADDFARDAKGADAEERTHS